jgi:hypothetical protein
MSVGDEVVVTAHEITAAEQQALVAQCTRCCLKDIAWWTVPAAAAGAVVGLLWGDGPRDVVGPLLVVAVLVLVHVVQVRRALRATFPVGLAVETVVGPHRLSTSTGSYALPQVTGLRTEGRVVRIDHGGDHSHLLPELVDVDLVRRRAGVPAPAPEPGPTVVVVPPGLGSRAARRMLGWRLVRDPGSLATWLGVVAFTLLGAWSLALTVVVAHLGALAQRAAVDRREFDRAFPAGIPVDARWQGWSLEVRSVEGLAVVPVQGATSARSAGDLFVVRRPGMPPLPLPDVVVDDVVRAELRGRI